MTSDRTQFLQDEIVRLKYRLRETERTLAAVEADRAELKRRVKNLENEINVLRSQGSLFGSTPTPYGQGLTR